MKKSVNRWITLCFTVILVLTMLISVGWNLYSTREAILDQEEASVRSCADLVAGMLDYYGMEVLFSHSDESLYRQLRYTTRAFCKGFQQNCLILYTVNPKTHVAGSFLSVAADDETDQLLMEGKDPGISRRIPETILNQALHSDRDSVFRKEGRKEILWYVPYHNKQFSDPVIICMQYSLGKEKGLIIRDFLMDIILPIAALNLSFFVLLILVRRRITLPLRVISESMERFALDSSRKPAPLNIPYGDEIGGIAESFEKMTEDISTYVNNIEVLTREKVETNVQLDVARRIQNGLVPEQCALEGFGFRIRAMTRPAKAVGGDFYDCFRPDETSVCIFMGDVSGKGISAAIYMAMAKTLIREKLAEGLSPAEALSQTNEALYTQNPEGLFATVFAGILNTRTGELRYANAGHTFPVLLKKEPAYLYPDSGIALGLFEDVEIQDESLNLAFGEGILLYTDGVTDAVNPQREFFGKDRLLEAVRQSPEEEITPENVLYRLRAAVGTFCDGNEPFDDMAVLVMFRTDGKEDCRSHTLPVALSSFNKIRKAVTEIAGDTPDTRKALLACDEALANIVRYSGAQTLVFSCETLDNELCITFADDGIPFDPVTSQAGENDFDLLDNGGMGLNIIRQSVSSIHYERKNDQNVLTMRFQLTSL